MLRLSALFALLLFMLPTIGCAANTSARSRDPLPSWNDGPAKAAILRFVAGTTRSNSPTYIPPDERIATFDNDGTLWSEQPVYTQFFFAIDRIKAMAPQHPEWKTQEPYASLLKGDIKAAMASGERGLLKVIMTTHANMTTAEFTQLVTDWIATARHPVTHKPYTEMVYQPMLELLAYLRANGFKTYIVSGGGVEFMRPWTKAVYGIPPEQVIGSNIKTKWEVRNGEPVLMRLPETGFVDDKTGKPIAINQYIGRVPVAAFGNSTGDQQMLEWTDSGGKGRPRLMMLVHHDDAVREWAYGPGSPVGTFSNELMETAKRDGWTVISMKADWNRIFPSER